MQYGGAQAPLPKPVDVHFVDQTRAFIERKLREVEVNKAREAYDFIMKETRNRDDVLVFTQEEHFALNMIFCRFAEILNVISSPHARPVSPNPFTYTPPTRDDLALHLPLHRVNQAYFIRDSMDRAGLRPDALEALRLLMDQEWGIRQDNFDERQYFRLRKLAEMYPGSMYVEAVGRFIPVPFFPQPQRYEFGVSFPAFIPTGQLSSNFTPGAGIQLNSRWQKEAWVYNFSMATLGAETSTPIQNSGRRFGMEYVVGINSFNATAGRKLFVAPKLFLVPSLGINLTNIRINKHPTLDSAGEYITREKVSVFTGAKVSMGISATYLLVNKQWFSSQQRYRLCDPLATQYVSSLTWNFQWNTSVFSEPSPFNGGFITVGLSFELGSTSTKPHLSPKLTDCLSIPSL